MCFAKVQDCMGRTHSADFFEGQKGQTLEETLNDWVRANPDKILVAHLLRDRKGIFMGVIEFVEKQD